MPPKVENNPTYTLTFCDQGENHVGMKKIGKLLDEGLTIENLENVKNFLVEMELEGVEMVYLDKEKSAAVLIVRSACEWLVNGGADALFAEQNKIEYDKKAKMRGRVVNKHARFNICIGETDMPPDYENGKGTVVGWNNPKITKLKDVRVILQDLFELENLVCEGNFYYNTEACGIGFHGDAERRVVLAIRLGASMPLVFKKFFRGEEMEGSKVTIQLNHGDLYVMSDKAVGFDWKKSTIPTFRHAAGCEKYTT